MGWINGSIDGINVNDIDILILDTINFGKESITGSSSARYDFCYTRKCKLLSLDSGVKYIFFYYENK